MLVKVMAVPVNPSDLYCMKGKYDEVIKIHYPSVPGLEGSGLVVQSGGGFFGWKHFGKRVAFSRKVDLDKNEMILGGCY